MATKRRRATAKAKRTKVRIPELATGFQQPSSPDWVISMHQHYRQTGFFRAEDLARVLGDPREGVQVSTCADMRFSGYTTK